MAISINFDKAKAERWLKQLSEGFPLSEVKNVDEILALAGACFYLAMSRAPELHQSVDWKAIGREPQSEDEDTFFPDLHAAIEYYGQLTMLVASGEYDQTFAPKHKAVVLVEDDEKTVVPVEGVRGEDD